MGYQHGAQVTSWLADDTVSTLRKAAFSAGHEAHLLTGFLRFSEQNGTLAAIITPKNRVLPLILEHFSSRFNAETFLIYDKTHHMALVHRPGQDAIIPMEHFSLEEPDETERQFRALWKQFYHTIGIEGRYNPKCRMTHMPKRYWENMTEFLEPALPNGEPRADTLFSSTNRERLC